MTTAEEIVIEIENDIRDRRGLRQEWEAIDEDVLDDIRDKWAKIINTIVCRKVVEISEELTGIHPHEI